MLAGTKFVIMWPTGGLGILDQFHFQSIRLKCIAGLWGKNRPDQETLV